MIGAYNGLFALFPLLLLFSTVLGFGVARRADAVVNYLRAQENGIVNIDVRKGPSRYDQHAGVQEAYFEARLKNLSSEYDFVS